MAEEDGTGYTRGYTTGRLAEEDEGGDVALAPRAPQPMMPLEDRPARITPAEPRSNGRASINPSILRPSLGPKSVSGNRRPCMPSQTFSPPTDSGVPLTGSQVCGQAA